MEHRDIFVSYIEEDGATVRALVRELRALGHSTWTYEEDGVGGISYLTQVNQAIEDCPLFVLVASDKSVRAHQVIREVEQAHEREKVIVPVRVGLSHQQFIASNPILRMACGTAVTLSADKDNMPLVAKRVASALTFAPKAQVQAAEADRGGGITDSSNSPSEMPMLGRVSSVADAVTNLASSEPITTLGNSPSPAQRLQKSSQERQVLGWVSPHNEEISTSSTPRKPRRFIFTDDKIVFGVVVAIVVALVAVLTPRLWRSTEQLVSAPIQTTRPVESAPAPIQAKRPAEASIEAKRPADTPSSRGEAKRPAEPPSASIESKLPEPLPPPPPPTHPVRVGGEIKQPTRIKYVDPAYPPIAASARVQGVVIIEAVIGPNGKVQDARVLRSIPLLDQAALDAVRQWEFTPTLLKGVPVPVIMTVTVQFTLS
jgi:TonB family protein